MFRPRRAFALVALFISLSQAGCLEKSSEHRIRANAFLRGGDAQSAVGECDLGLAIKKDDVALLILKGKALFELSKLDEAKASYEKAIDAGQNEDKRGLIEAHMGLAMIASRAGDWKVARNHFEKIVEADEGKNAQSQLNLARACVSLKDMECALKHGELAGRMANTDEATLFTLGTVFLSAEKPAEAEKTFERICEVVPGAASCPYGIAMVAAHKGDKPRALAKLKEAIDRKVPEPARIVNEPWFSKIKDDPEFLALVAAAQK
ncbi:MAG: tetratricopeptide repeat protein [Polyangiaceae bacterium]|nr:tetratricopeptide repeat protein [Polyangiaceae bacterium]